MSVRPKNLRGGQAPKSGLAWTGLALLIGATAQAQVAAQKSQIDAFVAQSGLPRNTVVSVKPDIVVAMRDHDAVIKTGANGKIRLTEALERLVQLYDAWDKPDDAAKWRKKLEETKTVANPTAKP